MNEIIIDGEIGWDITSRDFIDKLNAMSGDVQITISSGGGSVFQGVAIFNAIRNYERGTITVVITSLAASIASYIALAADKVTAHDNAVYMIHNASVFAWGDHRELRKKADIVAGLSGIIAKAYIDKTGKSEAEIAKLMDDETFYYGEEMQAAGFVDAIIETEEDGDKAQAVALASETFTACMKASNDRLTDEDFNQAAALLHTETPKPSKEGVQPEVDNTSKVNAMKARLSLKRKENHERKD